MVTGGASSRPRVRDAQLDRGASGRPGGDARGASEVGEPPPDARRDAEPALADGLVEAAGRDATAGVADRDADVGAVVVEQHPRLCALAGVLAHVVEGRL